MTDKIQEELEKEEKESMVFFSTHYTMDAYGDVCFKRGKLTQHLATKQAMMKEFENMILDEHNSREDIIKKLGELK